MTASSTLTDSFDQFARNYHEHFNANPIGIYQRRQVHALLRPFLKPDSSVLDVGCGPGSDFAFFKECRVRVEALDISAEMVRLAEAQAARLGLKVILHCADLRKFRPQGEYDCLLLNFGVINVFENPREALGNLLTALRPGGVLSVIAMPPFQLWTLAELLFSGRREVLRRRLHEREAQTAGGLRFYYHSRFDPGGHLRLMRRRNLAWLLPSPRQYRLWKWARIAAHLLMPIDRLLSPLLPVGGDHVCHIYRKSL